MRRPTVLHSWRIDEAIPFLDWTIWVYFSQYLLLLGSVWLVRKKHHISRLIYSLSLASLIGFAIFAICPIELPRQPREIGGLSKALFRLLYSIDTPANCFPSLHVALACLTVPSVAAARREWTFSAFIWAGLIAVSTLTTKQHNFVDVLGGLVLAILCYWLSGRLTISRSRNSS